METISYTALRADLAKKMKQVCDDHAPIIITRTHQKPVVILSLEDYESMEETNYLLRSSANAARISDAISEIETLIATQATKQSQGKSKK